MLSGSISAQHITQQSNVLTLSTQREAESDPAYPRERIILTHNQPHGMYLGDTVRFKLQVVNDTMPDVPSDISGIVYVQILNPHGIVLDTRKLQLDSLSRASGWLTVDSIYPSGFYELRAFTRYMTNWGDYNYPSSIIPVYCPESRLGKRQQDGVRYLDTENTRGSNVQRIFSMVRPSFSPRQPAEKQMMVLGHILSRAKKPTPEDSILGNRHLRIYLTRNDTVYRGEAVTDDLGRWATLFPPLKGDWRMFVTADPNNNDMKRHRVAIDETFSPSKLIFSESMLQPDKFGMTKFKEDKTTSRYKYHFYNCDNYSATAINRGAISQSFYGWLGEVCRQFMRTGSSPSPMRFNLYPDSVTNRMHDLNLSGKTSDDPRTVCLDGICYDRHPVVWIVNGCYRLVTALSKPITDFTVLRPTSLNIPLYLDEVKSVYITTDPEACKPYLRCSVLEKRKPVTVFITLRDNFIWTDSGLVNTFYHAFSEE